MAKKHKTEIAVANRDALAVPRLKAELKVAHEMVSELELKCERLQNRAATNPTFSSPMSGHHQLPQSASPLPPPFSHWSNIAQFHQNAPPVNPGYLVPLSQQPLLQPPQQPQQPQPQQDPAGPVHYYPIPPPPPPPAPSDYEMWIRFQEFQRFQSMQRR